MISTKCRMTQGKLLERTKFENKIIKGRMKSGETNKTKQQ
jgi:hypothetical protein